eukprot:Seg1498.6 transcript_id=Seg1498.6/GoldUCD/mRNA.D3Y31 product="hypothetical protein" protein_id=Seg1498.6/GoldUCD/D3Y31
MVIGNENMNSSPKRSTEMFAHDLQQHEALVHHQLGAVPNNFTHTKSFETHLDDWQHKVAVVHCKMDIVPTDITSASRTHGNDLLQHASLVQRETASRPCESTSGTSLATTADDGEGIEASLVTSTSIEDQETLGRHIGAVKIGSGRDFLKVEIEDSDLLEIEDSVMLVAQGSDWSLFKKAIGYHCSDSAKFRRKLGARVAADYEFDDNNDCTEFKEKLDREMAEYYGFDCNNNIIYPANQERDPAKDFMKASYEREHKSVKVMSKGKMGYSDAPFNSFVRKRPARGRSLKPVSLLRKREQNATVPSSDPLPQPADKATDRKRLDRTARGGKRRVRRMNINGKRLRLSKPRKGGADLAEDRHSERRRRNDPQPIHNSMEASFEALSSEQIKKSVERKIIERLQQEGSIGNRKREIPISRSQANYRTTRDIENSVQESGAKEDKKGNLSYKESQRKGYHAGSKSREDIEKDLKQMLGQGGKVSTKARSSETNKIAQENTLSDGVSPCSNDCEKVNAQIMVCSDSHTDLRLRQNFVKAITESFAKLSKKGDTRKRSRSISKDAKSEPNVSKEVGKREAVPLRSEGIVNESIIVTSQESFSEDEAPTQVPPLKDCDLICSEKFDADGTCTENVRLLSERDEFLTSEVTSVGREQVPLSEEEQDERSDENNPRGIESSLKVNLNDVEKDPLSPCQADFPEADLPEATSDLPEEELYCSDVFEMIEPFGETGEDPFVPSKHQSVYHKTSRVKKKESTEKKTTCNILRKIDLGKLPDLSEMRGEIPKRTKKVKFELSLLKEVPTAQKGNMGSDRSLFTSEEQETENQDTESAKLTDIQLIEQPLCTSGQQGMQNQVDFTSNPLTISQIYVENSPTKIAVSSEKLCLEKGENRISYTADSMSHKKEQQIPDQLPSTSGQVNVSQTFVENSPTKTADSPETLCLERGENRICYTADSMLHEKEQQIPDQLPSTSGQVNVSQTFVENSPTKTADSPETLCLERGENRICYTADSMLHEKEQQIPDQLPSTSGQVNVSQIFVENSPTKTADSPETLCLERGENRICYTAIQRKADGRSMREMLGDPKKPINSV